MTKLQLLLRESSRTAKAANEIATALARLGFEVLSVGTAALTVAGSPVLTGALMRKARAAGVLGEDLVQGLSPGGVDKEILGERALNAIEAVIGAVESVDRPPRHDLH